MNLNQLILTNIQGSSYFKVSLFKLKTYHEVVDEIYYQVKHLEPWERGSRKTSGQTGMCGGVGNVFHKQKTNYIMFSFDFKIKTMFGVNRRLEYRTRSNDAF